MLKKILLSSIIITIIYYILTFLISFTLLTKSVVNNNHVSLAKYINTEELKSNFYIEIHEFNSNLIALLSEKMKTNSGSNDLTGEFISSIIQMFSTKISDSIAVDFSNSEIILYFYFNSNELGNYLEKVYNNFGDYNFEKYLLEKETISTNNNQNDNNESNNDQNNNAENINEASKSKSESIISKLIKRYKSTDYFFLINPIHFKIDVKHQDIKFIIILKFNGYVWKVSKISIPYEGLFDPNLILK